MHQQTLLSDQLDTPDAPDGLEGDLILAKPTVVMGSNSRWTNRVTKSNRLITSFSRLSISEQLLLASAISKLNPTAPRKKGELLSVSMHATEIRDLTGINLKYVYEFLDKAARNYHSIPIETPGKKPGTISYINIAHRSDYDPETKIFKIVFHEALLDELVALTKNFTSYHLGTLTKLNSKYATRLYEILKMVADQFGTKTFYLWEPDELDLSLFYALGLRDGHGKDESPSLTSGFKDFRKKVLDRALEDINKNSDINARYVTHKQGKSVHKVQFFVTKQVVKESPARYAASLGIKAKTVQEVTSKYEEGMLSRNLTVLEQRLKSGLIQKPDELLFYLLKYNVADLPDLANPFAPRYRQNADQREFVKTRLMPIWWKLPEIVRQHLLEMGFTDPVLGREFSLFKKARNDESGTIGMYEGILLEEDELIRELTESYERINGLIPSLPAR